MKRLVFAMLALAMLASAQLAAAQPEPDDGPDVPTRLIEGGGLDIFAGATEPSGRMFRGRSRVEFELLVELERSFIEEIEDDAKQAVFE